MKTLLTFFTLFFSLIIWAEIPSDSVYQLSDQWQTSQQKNIQLSELKGKKQIFAMIYTHCMHTCPVIVANMKKVEAALAKENINTGFVLVSLTPASDTATVLHQFAKKMELNENNWTLLTGSEASVRTLSMALKLSYNTTADGEVSHSNSLVVLDENGRLIFTELGLPDGVEGFVEKVK